MRILVPVDNSSHSRHVINFLAHRETLLGDKPEIELVNVQYSVPEKVIELFNMTSVRTYYLEEGKKVFEALRRDVDIDKLHAVEKVLYGETGRTIAQEANETEADLIVMGQRGLNPMKSLFLGSVSNSVLANTKVPMLLLRDKTPPLTDKLRVGICVDGSEYGEAAANFVLEHLSLFGREATFEVIHAAEPLPDPIAPNPMSPMTPVLSREELDESQRKEFREAAAPVVECFKKAGVTLGTKLLFGEAGEVIPAYANESLDLVVMGSHGYGNFTAAVMGSTAMHLAARSEKPILVIRKK